MILVYSYYVMDILHRGHLEHLKNAKGLAGPNGRSIVGILTDAATMEKKPRPILHFEERLELARSLSCVDAIIAQETYSPLDNIKTIKPNILIESNSHSKPDMQIIEAMHKMNGRIICLPYFPAYSSTKIKEDVKDA